LAPSAERADASGTHVWLVLMKAHRSLGLHAARSLDGSGIGPSDFKILEVLLNKGPSLVNDIGRRIHLTSGAITTAIDRLEERALVRRAADERDRRACLVSLTKTGRASIAKAFAAHEATMNAAADALTKTERRTLVGLLKKLGLGAVAKLAREARSDERADAVYRSS
jgi:MarR family 2-MHQ and catechol resistance regulon transcriptional repressor